MAEKEERIWLEFDIPKPKGAVEATRCTTMTRHEAICKIGRAICRVGGNECIGDCESCDLWEVGPEKDYAEAALNALLGER